jgi:hypothetical protein
MRVCIVGVVVVRIGRAGAALRVSAIGACGVVVGVVGPVFADAAVEVGCHLVGWGEKRIDTESSLVVGDVIRNSK